MAYPLRRTLAFLCSLFRFNSHCGPFAQAKNGATPNHSCAAPSPTNHDPPKPNTTTPSVLPLLSKTPSGPIRYQISKDFSPRANPPKPFQTGLRSIQPPTTQSSHLEYRGQFGTGQECGCHGIAKSRPLTSTQTFKGWTARVAKRSLFPRCQHCPGAKTKKVRAGPSGHHANRDSATSPSPCF